MRGGRLSHRPPRGQNEPLQPYELIELPPDLVGDAMDFVATNVSSVDRAGIGRADDQNTQVCQRFLDGAAKAWSRPVTMPPHLWLAVVLDSRLIAALHASPKHPEAAELIGHIYARNPQAPSPHWVERFLNAVASVEEIAVDPEYRRQGLAQALLEELHWRHLGSVEDYDARASESGPASRPEVASVVTYSTNAASQALFASAGYLVGLPVTPIPRDYVAQAQMAWNPVFDHIGGSYCCVILER